MGTDFDGGVLDVPDDDGGDVGDGFMEVPGDDGAPEAPASLAERLAAAEGLDPRDADWIRNKGFRSESDLIASLRNLEGQKTRVEQEYAQLMDALRRSEETQDPTPASSGGGQVGEAVGYLAQAVNAGEMEVGDALAAMANYVLPQMLEAQLESKLAEHVQPVQSNLERMQLDQSLAEMEAIYGKDEARRIARQVMPMLQSNPYFSTPDGIKKAFAAAYGEQSLAERMRRKSQAGMATVDSSARGGARGQDMQRALEAWILKG